MMCFFLKKTVWSLQHSIQANVLKYKANMNTRDAPTLQSMCSHYNRNHPIMSRIVCITITLAHADQSSGTVMNSSDHTWWSHAGCALQKHLCVRKRERFDGVTCCSQSWLHITWTSYSQLFPETVWQLRHNPWFKPRWFDNIMVEMEE